MLSRPSSSTCVPTPASTHSRSGAWPCPQVALSAILVHVKNHHRGVQLARFLAIDELLKQQWCEEALEVTCSSGCHSFFTPVEHKIADKSARFKAIWYGRLDGASFCNGNQLGSSFCRVGVKPPRKCARRPTDLLGKEGAHLWRRVAPHTASVLNGTLAMQQQAGTVAKLA